MSVKVHVGRWRARGRRLPLVRRLGLTDEGHAVGTFTNPYAKTMPSGAYMNVVFLNAAGRIIGADAEPAGAAIRPHATVPFDLSASYNSIEQQAAVKSALVTIDPCGYEVGTRPCPVPGASG